MKNLILVLALATLAACNTHLNRVQIITYDEAGDPVIHCDFETGYDSCMDSLENGIYWLRSTDGHIYGDTVRILINEEDLELLKESRENRLNQYEIF